MNDATSIETYINDVFGSEGMLAAEFEGYQPRAGQIQLAQTIHDAINGDGNATHVIAEGPTGTGKSLAYSVPAIFNAKTTRKTVVIVTANIALQEQLVNKDLPLLKKILPFDFSFALLKGIGNYLCLDSLEETQGQQQLGLKFSDFDRGGDNPERYEQIVEWSRLTKRGDKNELPFEPGALWSKFSTSSDDCKRDKCDHRDQCFALAAIELAKSVDVIVTNYHVLCAAIMVARKTRYNVAILPAASVVVCDEAHKLPDIAREFFGMSLSFGSLKKVLRKATAKGRDLEKAGAPKGLADVAEEAAVKFFGALTDFYRSARYETRLKRENPVPSDDLLSALEGVRFATHKAAASIEDMTGEKKIAKRHRELELAEARIVEFMNGVREAFTLAREPECVYFLEEDRQERAVIRSKVIDVAPILAHDLFKVGPLLDDEDALDDPRPDHAVITSATLSTGGNFDFIGSELGAPMADTSTVIGQSPFSKEQSLLVVPDARTVPFANGASSEAFSARVPSLMAEIIESARGRTLCLFTSYKNLRATRDHLIRTGLARKYRILVQGDAPRSQLVAEFKADTSSVLLGTESFWAGVDVQGEALSCVAIDRLPFPHFNDPVMSMLSEHDDRAFFSQMVPRASIQLKQGVGRLIRTVNDRGVVVILDRRIVDKGYGKSIVRSLPDSFKSRSLEAVAEFLGEQ